MIRILWQHYDATDIWSAGPETGNKATVLIGEIHVKTFYSKSNPDYAESAKTFAKSIVPENFIAAHGNDINAYVKFITEGSI